MSTSDIPAATARPVFDTCEAEWLEMLEIPRAEMAPGHHLAMQLPLSKMVTLGARAEARDTLRYRVDFALLDRAGYPIAAFEVSTGSHAGDAQRGRRWRRMCELLQPAGIACYEITHATTIEALFSWIYAILGSPEGTAGTGQSEDPDEPLRASA